MVNQRHNPTAPETMMRILQINASARLQGANSSHLANAITARLQAQNPAATVELLDLARTPHPILDAPSLTALFTPAEQRSPEQAARIALDDALIAQVQAADVLVLGVPMYNFGVPVQFKAWVDAIARAGVTFRYTAQGPEGLLTGKKVYVAFARGGMYRDTPADTQTPYVKTVLSFLGLTDVSCVFAEGLSMGPDAAAKALADADAQIAQLLP